MLIFKTLNRTCKDLFSAVHNKPKERSGIDRSYRWTYRLAKWPTLANRHCITVVHAEARGHMRRKVLMPLLVPGVLWNEMEVFSADDKRSVHLRRNNGAGKDSTADGD